MNAVSSLRMCVRGGGCDGLATTHCDSSLLMPAASKVVRSAWLQVWDCGEGINNGVAVSALGTHANGMTLLEDSLTVEE